MGRINRVVVPGCVHHVTQRGNHRQTVFFSESDWRLYLDLLQRHFRHYGIRMLGYCLMSNHVHLVVIPQKPNSLAWGIGRLTNDYARWQHMNSNRTGHLWQNRYFSCPVSDDDAWKVMKYVELNPVRARMVERAWDWRWSSAAAHVRGIDETGMLDMESWRKHQGAGSWKGALTEDADEASNDQLRAATRAGRPFGNDAFARCLEGRLGRPLAPPKIGRPTKTA